MGSASVRSAPYDRDFYRSIESGSERAARRVLPLLLDLVEPRSVVDLGCGDGSWLSVCRELGVDDVRGLDGPWVDPAGLKIPADRFQAVDLTGPGTSFADLPRFDLAMSLEVAEHLPASAAAAFVERLTTLAPVVFFAAAVPGQGGTGHVNEQWADYWAERFAVHGYRLVDAVRSRLWDDQDVEAWYLQNSFLYVSDEAAGRSPKLAEAVAAGVPWPLRMVHPRLLQMVAEQPDLTLGRHLRRLPQAARVTWTNRLASMRHRVASR
jgi:SAM-dependent methyltransferase